MKRWSRSEREDILQQWQESTKSRQAFCREKGVSAQTLTRWERERGNGDEPVAFLPATMLAVDREERESARACIIRIGEHVVIRHESDGDDLLLERTIRAAVRACGRM